MEQVNRQIFLSQLRRLKSQREKGLAPDQQLAQGLGRPSCHGGGTGLNPLNRLNH